MGFSIDGKVGDDVHADEAHPAVLSSLPSVASSNVQEIKLENGAALTDEAIHAMVHVSGGLKRLAIPNASKVTDAPILALAKVCKQLQEVDFRGCHNLTDASPNIGYMHTRTVTLTATHMAYALSMQAAILHWSHYH